MPASRSSVATPAPNPLPSAHATLCSLSLRQQHRPRVATEPSCSGVRAPQSACLRAMAACMKSVLPCVSPPASAKWKRSRPRRSAASKPSSLPAMRAHQGHGMWVWLPTLRVPQAWPASEARPQVHSGKGHRHARPKAGHQHTKQLPAGRRRVPSSPAAPDRPREACEVGGPPCECLPSAVVPAGTAPPLPVPRLRPGPGRGCCASAATGRSCARCCRMAACSCGPARGPAAPGAAASAAAPRPGAGAAAGCSCSASPTGRAALHAGTRCKRGRRRKAATVGNAAVRITWAAKAHARTPADSPAEADTQAGERVAPLRCCGSCRGGNVPHSHSSGARGLSAAARRRWRRSGRSHDAPRNWRRWRWRRRRDCTRCSHGTRHRRWRRRRRGRPVRRARPRHRGCRSAARPTAQCSRQRVSVRLAQLSHHAPSHGVQVQAACRSAAGHSHLWAGRRAAREGVADGSARRAGWAPGMRGRASAALGRTARRARRCQEGWARACRMARIWSSVRPDTPAPGCAGGALPSAAGCCGGGAAGCCLRRLGCRKG
jgi:hypothetical protein